MGKNWAKDFERNAKKAVGENIESHFDDMAREVRRHVCHEHGERAKVKRAGRGLDSGIEVETCCENLRAEVVEALGGR